MKLREFIYLFIFSILFLSIDANAYDPNRIKRPYPVGETDPLPEGWKFTDVGNITPASDWCYYAEQGLYYLKCNGWQIFGSSPDEHGFIYFETDEDKQISVRIMDAEVVQGTAAKGFIMLRAGMEDDDPWVYIEIKTQNNNQACFCWRLLKGSPTGSTGGPCIQTGTNGSTFNPPNCYPRWIKFIRQGMYITGYHKDDVEGASWVSMGYVKKLALKGKAYMGIGACACFSGVSEYGGRKDQPGIYLFDNLEVTEIELPYEVLAPASVTSAFNEPLKPGRSKEVDITKVFGHAIGEYFTINCNVIDPTMADVLYYEKAATADQEATDGEKFRKILRITAKEEGVTTVRMNCTINGYSMETDYALCVSDGKTKEIKGITSAPYGWNLENLEIPSKAVEWGEEFVTKNLQISKVYPVFIGAWEYDWGGTDVGNHASTKGNNAPVKNKEAEGYIDGAIKYDFRDIKTDYNPKDANIGYMFAKDTSRAEVRNPDGTYSSDIDLAFLPANDTAAYTGKNELFDAVKNSAGQVLWASCRGFWTELLGSTDPAYITQKRKIRGLPYLTNTRAGDWVSYTIYAPRSGYYSITPWGAYKSTGADDRRSLQVDVNGITQIKELNFASGSSSKDWKGGTTTGDATTAEEKRSGQILLGQGKNHLKLIFNSANVNFLGLKVLFKIASETAASGITYDSTIYVAPKSMVDTTLMSDDEKERKDSIDLARLPEHYRLLTEEEKSELDSIYVSFYASLPTTQQFKETEIIEKYQSKIPSDIVDIQDKLDYINDYLTDEIDSLTIETTQQSTIAHIDMTSYFYKKGFDPTKPIEMSVKIDSITNTGKGTYLGLMFRTYDKSLGKLSSNSAFASFAVGAYEGGRLSYRWDYSENLKKMDNADIAQNVYLKVRLNEYSQGYLTAYYSYDNLYWWEFLVDPLKVDFLSDTDNSVVGGLFLTGGSFANNKMPALGKVRNLKITQYEKVEDFDTIDSQEDMKILPLVISPSSVTGSETANISFNVTKPGDVFLAVYDMYGVLVETVKDHEFMDFSKQAVTVTHSFTQLKESGIYLLKLQTPNNEQYVRFRYFK